MRYPIKGTVLAAACCAMTTLLPAASYGANWLMLQGTEKPNAAPTTLLWGFLQPSYSQTDGGTLKGGAWAGQDAVFNLIAPDLETESQFYLQRARIGVRGQNFPLNANVNYLVLAEFGNNGITSGDGGGGKLTDASVTLNHIPGARIRAGQFKYPGSEEGLQAVPYVSPYVNFTNVTDTLLLERYFDRSGIPTNPGALCTTALGGTADTCANRTNGAVGAFRDVGVQVFDTFAAGEWEHSYAVMLGNGNGIARGDNDDNKDVYTYLSSERVYVGEGPLRDGLKFFIWNQSGKRTLVSGGTGAQNGVGGTAGTTGEFDRKRRGAGVALRTDRYRAMAEYVKADGMIFDGTDGGAVPGAANNAGTAFAGFNIAPVDEADGYYIDFGYRMLPALELNLRYDLLNRRTETAAAEREFVTTTIGLQYFFDKRNRLTVNYELREAEAPNLPGTDPANLVLDSMDDRLSLQLTSTF